jgi:hypothetical protein
MGQARERARSMQQAVTYATRRNPCRHDGRRLDAERVRYGSEPRVLGASPHRVREKAPPKLR